MNCRDCKNGIPLGPLYQAVTWFCLHWQKEMPTTTCAAFEYRDDTAVYLKNEAQGRGDTV